MRERIEIRPCVRQTKMKEVQLSLVGVIIIVFNQSAYYVNLILMPIGLLCEFDLDPSNRGCFGTLGAFRQFGLRRDKFSTPADQRNLLSLLS